ncbi:bifunctional alpha/beta hydrolase/OsmC family protein [Polymorphum gilvum]|uniref:OsmC-like protein n=1 Tax=Polymorphum gilvum (strain LMG 25793 / CGMCC 1.9160 / SL003B-26A1) TaxID=991905 RepID=F2J6F4_POLGS|nr:OsmC-like protein [Polymorphum gilvum SL003B-26A1]
MAGKALKIEFEGSKGARLAARLDLPAGAVRAYALFAHCFTCSKDLAAARHIAGALTRDGFAVLRFDFTGLGASGGDFASTDFSSNLEDLKRAADHLRRHFAAPALLVGHSLGGTAALAVAGDLPEVRAVATIGAPADAAHVLKSFHGSLDEIHASGEARVTLAGRAFTIRKDFVDDLDRHRLDGRIRQLRRPLLVLHAPLDEVVGIDNATEIFIAARHPKSFVSLDKSDHLLSDEADAAYAARVIAAWASRYVGAGPKAAERAGEGSVEVAETGYGTFQVAVRAGPHRLLADEPEGVGGLGSGPSPYDYLAGALGACTVMTLRLYADRKGLPVERISTRVTHAKVHAEDCLDCSAQARGKGGRIDRFERTIAIEGEIDPDTRARMLEIADKCPVHRTLEAGAAVVTHAAGDGKPAEA